MHSKLFDVERIIVALLGCVAVSCGQTYMATAGPVQEPPPISQVAPPPGQPPVSGEAVPAHLTPAQLQQVVAPIALYPDPLVAQILAASAYPTQIVEAERFLQEHSNLQGAALGLEVDKQDWDPSVKALTQYPAVLADLDKNLSWTSELGDVNVNQQADVMAAIQVMRQRAQNAGTLMTTPQQTVTNQGGAVVVQPADPQVVYIPEYDPALVYGYPVGLWPGFVPWWSVTGPYVAFSVGFPIAPFFVFGWGGRAWGCDWFHQGLLFGGGRYVFHSQAFYDRNAYFHGNLRPPASFARGDRGLRGFQTPAPGRAPSAAMARPRVGAFSGITHGGSARGFGARGRVSMGGMRGGGARGGGRR